MTPDDWQRLLDEAAAIGVRTVQFIGEPTLDPDMPRLARYALGIGLKVDIKTNLVHVTPEMWELFSGPRVSVGISWYSADPAKHAEVTGSRASYACTRANVVEAVRRGIRLNAGVVEVVEGQDIDAAIAELRALGVTSMIHPDGSWARATAVADQAPVIRQTGPRPLRTLLDQTRRDWLTNGSLPAHGARVTITPDGTTTLKRGRWEAPIPADC